MRNEPLINRNIPFLRKMAGTLFLSLAASTFTLQAADSALSVTLKGNNRIAREYLAEIENQTDYLFVYDANVNVNKKLSLHLENTSVREALDLLTSELGLSYTVEGTYIVLSLSRPSAVKQARKKVSGIVTDENGDPIIGANIKEKGTQNGVITDLDGQFALEVAEGTTLQVSYIGYETQEVKVGAQEKYAIQMKANDQSLNEVVVVGFGTQKKVNLTGSVGMVNAKELSSRPVANATQALQGLVPGLQITQNNGRLDGTPTINIRGIGTISSGTSGAPLVLIDGMEGDLNTINPQDIENISVLKDAAASSIYGSRAPFGVIMVTTKTGKEGKTSVNYNNSFRWNSPINMPEMMDSYTFATYFNDAADNAIVGRQFSDEHLQRIKAYQEGKLTSTIPADTNGHWMDAYSAGNANTNLYDIIYKDVTFSQEHNMSANGGNERVNYYLSFNYLGQGGLLRCADEDLNRYNITGKFNAALLSWVHLNYSTRWTRQSYHCPITLNNSLFDEIGRRGWPTLPVYDPNGYIYSAPSPLLGLATGGEYNTETDWNYQQFSFILEPIEDWITHIDFNYRTSFTMSHSDKLVTYNHDVNGVPYAFDTDSYVQEQSSREKFLNFNVYSAYHKSILEKHNLKVMVGFQTETLKQKKSGLRRDGILIPELPEVDLTTGLDFNGKSVIPSVNGGRSEWATAGFFGRLNYDFMGRYLVEFNLRYDGTSRFRRDNRWITLPSVSLGWNVAQEKFWESFQSIVNQLKIRGSYGELGNQNTNNWYQTYRTINISANSGQWLQDGVKPNVAYFPGLVSTVLSWERVRNWNIGLDFGMFNNRLTGSAEYYIRDTKDMVGPAPELPATLGTSVPNSNNTDLRTSGLELEVSWRDRLRNGLGYGVKATLSDSRTKVTRYPQNATNSLNTYIPNRYLNEIWGFETIGIAKSETEMKDHLNKVDQSGIGNLWGAGDIMYSDLDGDGKISKGASTLYDHGDLKVIGNSTPRYLFSLDITADWKGFDFRAFFQGVMKRDYWQGSPVFWGVAKLWGAGNIWVSWGLKNHVDYFRAKPSNDLMANTESYYPRPVFDSDKNQQVQTKYLQNASYIRLKNLQVGYSLPHRITNKYGVSNLRIFFSGENLWTGTALPSLFDPETIDGGFGGSVYPLTRTFSCGLSITL